MQSRGLCDGFLWPYECGRLPQFRWSDGTEASRYETRRGTLFMHSPSVVAYGYREESDFARAARRAQLTARTTQGIITVGMLRSNPKCDHSVYMSREDCPVRLEFPVCTPAEEQEVSDTLRKNFPGSRVVAGPHWLGGIQAPTPSLTKTLGAAWKTRHRSKLVLMGTIALLATILSVVGLFDRQWHLVAGCLSLLFVAFFASFCKEASCETPASSLDRAESPTPEDRPPQP